MICLANAKTFYLEYKFMSVCWLVQLSFAKLYSGMTNYNAERRASFHITRLNKPNQVAIILEGSVSLRTHVCGSRHPTADLR